MRRRLGVTAILFLLLLPILLMFVAFVIDLGIARLVRAQLRAAVDIAAFNGADALDGTAAGMAAAEAAAIWIGGQNDADGEPVTLTSADVTIGVWEGGTFSPTGDPERANAVRVEARRDDMTPFFGRLFLSAEALSTSVSAIASRGRDLGAGGVPYYLPFALPECLPRGYTADELADMEFTLSPAGEDTTAWGLVGTGTSAHAISEHLAAMVACMQQYQEEGRVDEACTPGGVDQAVDLDNGVAASALKELADVMAAEGVPWDEDVWGPLPPQHPGSDLAPADYGKVLVGPIPIFDGGDAYCAGGAGWTETLPVTGWVWAVIYDVRSKGAASEKNIWMRIDLAHPHPIGEGFGGGNWGVVTAGPPVVVQ